MRIGEIVAALGDCRRIVIVGGPSRGKSTLAAALAESLQVPHRQTDDLLDGPDPSGAAAEWLRAPGPQIVEGVAAVRGLRRLAREGESPGAVVIHLRQARAATTPQQEAAAKGVDTIWREVAPELKRRRVRVLEI